MYSSFCQKSGQWMRSFRSSLSGCSGQHQQDTRRKISYSPPQSNPCSLQYRRQAASAETPTRYRSTGSHRWDSFLLRDEEASPSSLFRPTAMQQYKRVYSLLRQCHLLLKHHRHIARIASSGLVVISLYSWVFRGKLFSKGTILPAQRISPQPAATLVI